MKLFVNQTKAIYNLDIPQSNYVMNRKVLCWACKGCIVLLRMSFTLTKVFSLRCYIQAVFEMGLLVPTVAQ